MSKNGFMSEVEWLEAFGDNLATMLEEYGLTQSELAEEAGLAQSTISSYVNGQKMPTARAIINIVDALGCSFDELLDMGYPIE